MCLDCIKQLDPPTPQLAKSRSILQLLAAGLFILSLFAILAGQSFSIFFMMILGMLLFMSWSEFSYQMTLNFFIICCMQVIFVYFELISIIQYSDQITKQHSSLILYSIAKLVYYPNAVFFSHDAYRKFKQYAKYSVNNQSLGDYQLMPMNNRPQQQQNHSGMQSSGNFMPFRGQATFIG